MAKAPYLKWSSLCPPKCNIDLQWNEHFNSTLKWKHYISTNRGNIKSFDDIYPSNPVQRQTTNC